MDTAERTGSDQFLDRGHLVHAVRQKQAFWRQVWVFAVFSIAYPLAWIIDGVRREWVTPWPLAISVVWGLFLLGRARKLGGREALNRRTIDREVDALRHPYEPIFRTRTVKRPITFTNTAGYQPIREFHLQDVVDARAQRGALSDAPDPHMAEG